MVSVTSDSNTSSEARICPLQIIEEENDWIFRRCHTAKKRSEQKLEPREGTAAITYLAFMSDGAIVNSQFGRERELNSPKASHPFPARL
jgi:hypothetical protein